MKKRLKSVHHLITGFYLALEGYAKLAEHHYLTGGIIGLSGLMIIGYFIYSTRTGGKHRTLSLLVSFSEAAALFFTSYVYFVDGKRYIQYATLVPGIAYLIAAGVTIIKQKRSRGCSS
jgi:hypothetical protein